MTECAAVAEISKDIPTVLYRLYDRQGALLYIGISWRLRARFKQHAKTKEWWPQVDAMVLAPYPSEPLARDAETIAIAVERPAHNNRKQRWDTTLSPRVLKDWGFFIPGRDVPGGTITASAAVPGHIARILGIEPGVPVIFKRTVYARDGVPLWMVMDWEAASPGVTPRCTEKHRVTRGALAHEARELEIEPGTLLEVTWYGSIDLQSRNWTTAPLRSITEIARPPMAAPRVLLSGMPDPCWRLT